MSRAFNKYADVKIHELHMWKWPEIFFVILAASISPDNPEE